jgi:hypothetical protein
MPLPPVVPRQRPDAPRPHDVAALAVLLGLTLLVPIAIRGANASQVERRIPATYLPALEGPRERRPFDASRVPDLIRLNPGYVVIGDSMAGTRIDERRLGELAGRPVAPLLQAGSGPAFWYLALKNWVAASGVHPRVVFIFFRDTNLTDVLFRLDEQFRWSVDLVAAERERELDAVIAARLGGRPRIAVQRAVERLYQGDRARTWVEPALLAWPSRVLFQTNRRRGAFMEQMNARLGLDHLRPMDAADIASSDDPNADFDRYVDRSTLPLMLDEARRAGLTLCFVRVQRRPIGNRPPVQSAAMQRYVRELRAYLESRGARFHDDTGDPELTLDMYEDGDHIAKGARQRYTEILFDRLRPLFQ